MIDLVRKRHDGDGWIVVSEAAREPGPYNSRRADAIALSVWASKKYEAHLYEFKESREDLKREIRDPSKVEGVGKFCTYWWICVRNESILKDLVIPEAWGILVVHVDKVAGKEHRRLKVVRKAPKQKAKPIDVMFAVSLIRNIRKTYVDPSEHRKLQEEMYELRHGTPRDDEEEQDLRNKLHASQSELQNLKSHIKHFEEKSGVVLGKGSWEWGNIGRAIKTALRLNDLIEHGDIHAEVSKFSRTAEELETRAAQLAESAVLLRSLLSSSDHPAHCAVNNRWHARCTCGLVPLSEVERKLAADVRSSTEEAASDRDDDPGSGVNRGDAGAPEQDAGLELRDQRPEVPHGQPAP